MAPLASEHRRLLESAVVTARRASEAASRAALENLGVFVDRRPEHLGDEQSALRVGLRAKLRQLGGDRELIISECAYEQWHRLLFARFLAENGLLIHPEFKAPVTLGECQELADELGEPDGWAVAGRFAAQILPGIFRLEDPCVRLRLAPEGRHALEEILADLPVEVFRADDALGWVYQYWQKEKKDEVNASERKIGGADLGPVTQLFTENYMVRFLLQNSLGAWWTSRHPDSPLVSELEYMRVDKDGRPAAGSFDEWPEHVAEVTVMDPCCGSGHFLVEAFSLLWRMRAEEDGLSLIEAQDAVLRENLFGLELDPRCVQIALFAVAMKAWTVGGGWRQLSVPNIACTGIPVKAPLEEWLALAKGDPSLEAPLTRLHRLFGDADTLGSLIDPRVVAEQPGEAQTSIDEQSWEIVAPLLGRLFSRESVDPAESVLGAGAAGIAAAADLLSRKFTLVTTNVPYLKRANQSQLLRDYTARCYPSSSFDLGVVFFDHFLQARAATVAFVTPTSWTTATSFTDFRTRVLSESAVRVLAFLGSGAFQAISGEVVNVTLSLVSSGASADSFFVLDASGSNGRSKADTLMRSDLISTRAADQLNHPDHRILLPGNYAGLLLSEFARAYQGLATGDYGRFGRFFWEVPRVGDEWSLQQSTVSETVSYGGREHVVRWERGVGELAQSASARVQGLDAWNSNGIAISQMGKLPATLYTGEIFDNNTAALIPLDQDLLPAIWAFVSSAEYGVAVRAIDDGIKVTNATLTKVPFDKDRWIGVAIERFPAGLPEPSSIDPAQWLFAGAPLGSTAPLQVAVARLVGYRWPGQDSVDDLDALTDSDGVVCLPSVAGEAPASDRVEKVLAAAFGAAWNPSTVRALLDQAASRKTDLADWLRDEFFKQHCARFDNRPFVWHVWDGLRDGFSALVNYHRLDRRLLEKLTYTYLGQDWVERQRAGVRDSVAGAESRLAAALELQRKLEAILEGEKPFDIYVRWKPRHEQPIGWDPDPNDGVRLNVRPFVEAGVLRAPFSIHWKKDRGRNPDGSERHNDIHLSLDEKREARRRAGVS